MDITLIVNLPRQEAERPPAVVAALAGFCKANNKDYDVFDLNLNTIKTLTKEDWRDLQNYLAYYTDELSLDILQKFKNLVIEGCVDQPYKVIAVSLFTYETLRAANIVLPLLRKKYPDAKILIGGHGADFPDKDHHHILYYKRAIAEKFVDAYILGEGDEKFQEFLRSPNSWINSDQRHTVSNLDDIPFSCYDKIVPQNYLSLGQEGVYVTGSRGCVRDCTFCDVGAIWGKYRFRSAKNLFDEILEHHLKHNVNTIEFTDNLINGSLSEFKKLNRLLATAREKYPSLKNIKYRGNFICRPSTTFTEDDFKTMQAAGSYDLVVGIESFSHAVRLALGKNFSNEDIDFHLYCTGKYGITNTFLMLVGYPDETLEDHKINLECLKHYQKYAQSRVIKMIRWGTTVGILPGSPLDVMTKTNNNFINEHDVNPTYGNWAWVNLNNPDLTFLERVRRRMELHYASKRLGYNQPRVYDEFEDLLQKLKEHKPSQKILRIQNV